MNDIHDIRRSRVEQLLARYQTKKALADAIGREPAYVSFILSNNPTYKKNIGEDLARSIEQKIGLGAGWLDRLEGEDGDAEQVIEKFQRAGENKRNAMKELADLPEDAAAALRPIMAAFKAQYGIE